MKVSTASIITVICLLAMATPTLQGGLVQKMVGKLNRAFPRLSRQQKANAKDIIIQSIRYTKEVNQIAYILATAYGESKFKPIKEIKARTRPKWLVRAQSKYWPSGFYGRGYVQLTWDYNYKKFGRLLNIPLYRNPNLALNPKFASQIIAIGMTKGLFTGRGLSRYISARKGKCDFKNARRIINGTFEASKFAEYARKIARA